MVTGLLRNIIVAVVVDTFAEARQNDILNLAEEMEQAGLCFGITFDFPSL